MSGTIRFIIPQGAQPGSTIHVPAPSGATLAYQIPAGVYPGQEVEINDPTAQEQQFLEVAIPQGAPPGSTVEVNTSNGKIQFVVPPGTTPGTNVKIPINNNNATPPPAQVSNNSFANPSSDIELGNMNASSRPSYQGTQQRTGRRSLTTAQFVVPEGAIPGSVVNVPHPISGQQVLVKIPPNAQPGAVVELEFDKHDGEPQQHEMDTVKIQVPENFVPGDAVEVRLPDGRTLSVNFPRFAEPGHVYDIQVPKDSSVQTGEIDIGGTSKAHFKPSDYPDGNGDIVEASMNSGLKYDELVLVVWRKKDTIFRCDMAVIGPALYKFIDADGDGDATIEELSAAITNPDILAYVDSIKCPVLGRLFHNNPRSQIRAFKKIDQDGSGSISLQEWESFLNNVQRDRLKFYRKQFLLKDYVFMGRGMEPGEPYSTYWMETLGVHRGFWEDFKYYTANNHPLLMIFYSDRVHPYSRNQRTAEFIGCFMTAFWGAGILLSVCDDGLKIGYSILAVTVPTTIFRKIVYTFFTCSCLLHDESKTGEKKHLCLACCGGCAAGFAYLFSLAWILFMLIFGIVFWIQFFPICNSGSAGGEFAYFLYTICQYWVLWFVAMFFLDFNPFPSSVEYFSWVNKFLSCFVANRVGRWYIERQQIESIIREKINERGPDCFFLPEKAQTLTKSA